MADDKLSAISDYKSTWTPEHLGRTLVKTREQLKAAIARIIELEKREADTNARMNALELTVKVELGKLQVNAPEGESKKSKDSIDEQLNQLAEAAHGGGVSLGITPDNIGGTKGAPPVVRGLPGGRSGPSSEEHKSEAPADQDLDFLHLLC